jgi:hypothetical protein
MALGEPLFLQDGKYRAYEDRYLIGGLAYPAGGTDQCPRPGVLPFGILSGQTTDQSLRVTPAGSNSPGMVIIDKGSAIIAGPDKSMAGGYLCINDTSETFNCLSGGEQPSGQTKIIYLEVVDPEFSGGSDSGQCRFIAVPQNTAAPAGALRLATVRLPAAATTVVVSDDRSYTTTRGGNVIVPNEAALTTGTMGSVPLGSSAYVDSSGVVYTRTKRGWEKTGAVPTGLATARPTKDLYQGQMFYETDTGLLMMCVDGLDTGWVVVGQRQGEARRQNDSDYAGKRRAHVVTGQFYVNWNNAAAGKVADCPASNVPGNVKPAANDLIVRFKVKSNKTLVAATLTTGVWVCAENNPNAFLQDFAFVSLRLTKYLSPSVPDVVDYPWPADGTGAVFRYGLQYFHQTDGIKSRTFFYQLDQGEYQLEPWVSTGVTAAKTLYFQGMCIEVAL